MENIIENKAKFVALYWGQIVAKITKGSYTHRTGTIHVVDKNVISSIESEGYVKHKYSLELAPVSSITDQDAISVFNIKTSADLKITREPHSNSIRVNYDYWADSEIGFVSNYFYVGPECISHECALKLIAMGYYVGDGKEIEYGWVKLKDKEYVV